MDATPAAPASLPNYLADGIPKQSDDGLEDVIAYAEALLDARQAEIDADELPDGAEPVDDESGKKGTVVKERVKCGADCTCNDGEGHGPYLYRYYREDGKLKSKYEGKP